MNVPTTHTGAHTYTEHVVSEVPVLCSWHWTQGQKMDRRKCPQHKIRSRFLILQNIKAIFSPERNIVWHLRKKKIHRKTNKPLKHQLRTEIRLSVSLTEPEKCCDFCHFQHVQQIAVENPFWVTTFSSHVSQHALTLIQKAKNNKSDTVVPTVLNSTLQFGLRRDEKAVSQKWTEISEKCTPSHCIQRSRLRVIHRI